MKLARYFGDITNIAIVRDLTEDELASHERFTPVVGEAMERFVLFKILAQNYAEWRNYVRSLLSAGVDPIGSGNERLNLDRLLLNYLTCAYTIREHCEVSFQQRFRNDKSEAREARSVSR
jgi:hypothetical protein